MVELQNLCRTRGWFLLFNTAQTHGTHNGAQLAAAFNVAAVNRF